MLFWCCSSKLFVVGWLLQVYLDSNGSHLFSIGLGRGDGDGQVFQSHHFIVGIQVY
jgi:hypothetical protein